MSQQQVAQMPCPDEWQQWLNEDHAGRFVLCDETIALAEKVALAGWQERARENGRAIPDDLSNGCKFSSLFVKFLFGGCVEGHYDHQFNVIDDEEFDLNAEAEDVRQMRHPYWHDEDFIGSYDHVESMKSCLLRVLDWLSTFESMVPASYALKLDSSVDASKKPENSANA